MDRIAVDVYTIARMSQSARHMPALARFAPVCWILESWSSSTSMFHVEHLTTQGLTTKDATPIFEGRLCLYRCRLDWQKISHKASSASGGIC